MDGNTRNWVFADPESKASQHPSPFLKMSAYSDRDALIHESDSGVTSMDFSWVPSRNFYSSTKSESGVTSMDFSWVPSRNFYSSTKSMGCLDVAPISSRMMETPSAALGNTPQTSDHEAKTMKARKQQCFTKGVNSIAKKVLRPKEAKKQTSPAGKKTGSSRITENREKMIRTAEKIERINRTGEKHGNMNSTTEKREKVKQDAEKRDEVNRDQNEEGATIDFSGVPPPICSCTGVPRQCYRWGCGAWQSSCCTTAISAHPLPMSPSKIGSRLAGRKMTIGAYEKLLHRLAADGQDLSHAVDLKDHWARHGTNKFVIIK